MDSIQVIDEWILVKPEASEKISKGGIHLIQSQDKIVHRAEVVQISPDVAGLYKEEKGKDAELKYSVGDTVLFYGKTGIPIEDGEDKYMFLKYDGMLAIEVK